MSMWFPLMTVLRTRPPRRRMALTSIVPTLVLFLAIASLALAEDHFCHGALCHAADSSSHDRLFYKQFGAANASTTSSATVVCGTTFSGGDNNEVTDIAAEAFDRNPNPNQNVCCTFRLLDRFTGF